VLAALPHVGSALVDRWVKAREERPFRSLQDARMRVRGLGAATIEQIGPYFDFPQGEEFMPTRVASHTSDRPATKPRTNRRKTSGAAAAARAARQPRLAARSSDPVGL